MFLQESNPGTAVVASPECETLNVKAPPEAARADTRQSRPFGKRAMHLIRRGHLYLGLFLFPWALLYGVTAFLFNHPTAFSDQQTSTFGAEALAGTPMADLPSPTAQAELVVAKLNESKKPATPFQLAGEALYGREFAFATVRAEGQTLNVLVDVLQGQGTVRGSPIRERPAQEKAPFATGASPQGGRERGGQRGAGRGPSGNAAEGIKLEQPLQERLKAAVPAILKRLGLPDGEVTVTSVPDLVFPLEAEGRLWTATYNPMTGAISGAPAEGKPAMELGWRRFLLRLHTAHGYSSSSHSRWIWALIVDCMAGTMCFWGLSGLLMWWQLKATRRLGVVLVLSGLLVAAVLGWAMHTAMTS